MKFFIDTADVAKLRDAVGSGLVDGVTTNPSLIMKSGRDFIEVIGEICEIVQGPVSAEVTAVDADTMIREGHALARISPHVVIKVPMTWDGLRACRTFTEQGIKTNVTLCFSANQGLLAARAGATFVSPFIGRLDDIGEDGVALIADLRQIFDQYGFKTNVLAASIRSPEHVKACALAGADYVTIPPETLQDLVKHPLTDKGLEAFLADWSKTGQTVVA